MREEELREEIRKEIDDFYSIAPKYRTKKNLVKFIFALILRIKNENY